MFKYTLAVISVCASVMFSTNAIADAQSGINDQQVSVAVLSFSSGGSVDGALGETLVSSLEASLSMQENVLLVERQDIDTLLSEQSMNLTGLTDGEMSLRIGKLLGAQILVKGRIIAVNEETMILAKLISSETGQVIAEKSVFESSLPKLSELSVFTDKISSVLSSRCNELVPPQEPQVSAYERVSNQLGSFQLPEASVSIPEVHITRPIPDPAAQTAIADLWLHCGGTLIEASEEASDEPEVIISGEAFSEFGLRKGDLVLPCAPGG